MAEVLALGLSHKTAPLELRERLALTEGRATSVMNELTAAPEIREATVVSTCNRTELYLVAEDTVEAETTALSVLSREAEIRPTELTSHLYSLRASDAARHLFQVTAGLDSMIIGEAEIQGQVKRAYELSLVEGATGPILNRLFRGAISAGGRARNETGISEKGVSVPSVAVELARRTLGDLSTSHALVIGAGETADLVARALVARGSQTVFVANRHYDRAIGLAQRFGGAAVRIDDLPNQLEQADIVISATNSPHHLVGKAELAQVLERRKTRPIHLVDLAVPRDIDPGCRDLEGVTLSDVDDIQSIVKRNTSGRESEARKAEHLIESELKRFERWLASLEVVPTVVALREHSDEIVRRVLSENENRWEGLTEADRQRVETMARAIASRMLHEPTLQLKKAAGSDEAYEIVNALRELFGLDIETATEGDLAGLGDAAAPPRPPLVTTAPGQIRVATRKSLLALTQSGLVAERLEGAELLGVDTDDEPGDKERFVRAVESAVLNGRAEVAVHSAKDLPGVMTSGLEIAAVPAREDARDAWIGAGDSLADVPQGARVGTVSLRRRAQLLAVRPDLVPVELRGNVDTRIGKLRAGEVDAIVLAMAGLRRLGREDEVSFTFGLDEMTPAAGQGSLVVQTRTGGAEATGAPANDDDASNRELRAERAAVVGLEADCSSPVGIHARHQGDVLVMDGFIGLADGSEWLRDQVQGDPSRPEELGGELARRLRQAGGADILARAQEKFPGLDV